MVLRLRPRSRRGARAEPSGQMQHQPHLQRGLFFDGLAPPDLAAHSLRAKVLDRGAGFRRTKVGECETP